MDATTTEMPETTADAPPMREAPVPPEVSRIVPRSPMTLADTGLPEERVTQLLLKSLYTGEATGIQLAGRLRLPYAVLEKIVDRIRAERFVEVRGSTGTGTASYRYVLTDLGRDRARQFLDINQYVGPAPVPLAQYVAVMKGQKAEQSHVTRDRVRAGFSHLIVNPIILEQLGPAINSGKAIFLYGPPGNGKTVLAEGMGRTIGGETYLPYAIDIEGQIITVYDPVNHEAVDPNPGTRSSGHHGAAPEGSGHSGEFWHQGLDDERTVIVNGSADQRWVRVKRPVVVVGGELTLDMLDLSFNNISRFYEAPLQLKANGGVFVVDDFGRQRMRPADLLNRWIVPLESRVDYLTLHTGKKFQVPFDVLIVFATNLKPETLADEAFLRRIPYKIFARNPTAEEFSRIFEMNCRRRGLAFDPVIVEYLRRRYYEPQGIEMRACHPRDLVEHVVDLIKYQNRPNGLTRDLLDAACESFFLRERESLANEAAAAARSL